MPSIKQINRGLIEIKDISVAGGKKCETGTYLAEVNEIRPIGDPRSQEYIQMVAQALTTQNNRRFSDGDVLKLLQEGKTISWEELPEIKKIV